MFVNKDDDDDDEHDSGDYYINDHDKQDNSHDTVPWKGDNLNIQSYITSRRRSGVVIVNLTWESQHAIDAVRGAESLETSRIRTEDSLKYSVVQEHLACLIAVRMGRLPISDMRSRPVRL